MVNGSFSIRETDKRYFQDVFFLVEATSEEKYLLWEKYGPSLRAKASIEGPSVFWKDESAGYMIHVGNIADRPIMVHISYATLNGKKVMFYEGVSELVDHKMIHDWVHYHSHHIRRDNGHRWAQCNTANFNHCLRRLKEDV